MKMTIDSATTAAAEQYISNLQKNSSNGYGLYVEGGDNIKRSRFTSAIELQLFCKGVSFFGKSPVALFGEINAAGDTDKEIRLLKKYVEADVLVLHDLGCEPLTLREIETLYQIVCGRYESMLPTIVTSDCGYDELAAHLTPDGDDRTMSSAIVRRLRETTVMIAAA